jgi:hypothetical protein
MRALDQARGRTMDFDWMQMLKAGLGTLLALLVVVGLFVMFVRDVTQKKHTVLRNFPVIGRFRYWFEELGEYLPVLLRTTARNAVQPLDARLGLSPREERGRRDRLRLHLRPAPVRRPDLRQPPVSGTRGGTAANAFPHAGRGLREVPVRGALHRQQAA